MKLTRMAQELLDVNDDLFVRAGTNDPEEFYDFDQTWGSTALGFPGMGGQAITTARTYVAIPNYESIAYVYFGGRFAYKAVINERFNEDLAHHCMASVMERGRYG